LLVEAGADATLKDGEGLTPLDYAKEGGDAQEVVAYLRGSADESTDMTDMTDGVHTDMTDGVHTDMTDGVPGVAR
jgi:hypothetical protein